jgi:hypothetical protein
LQRSARTPKPSTKVRANRAPATAPSKVARKLVRRKVVKNKVVKNKVVKNKVVKNKVVKNKVVKNKVVKNKVVKNKVVKKKGATSSGGGVRSQSMPPSTTQRALALTQAIDISSSPPALSDNASVDSGGNGTDDDLDSFLTLEDTPPPPPPPQMVPFEYMAQWRIICKKEKLNATIRRFDSVLTHTPVAEAKSWIESEVA